jgi:thiopeptide-type bacteriocin biosynthesis protein
MTEKPSSWLSYHLFLPWTGNEFIADFLPSVVNSLQKDRLIKRFFFIRYAIGGYHLRLRFQPSSSQQTAEIEEKLQESVNLFRLQQNFPESLVFLEKAIYNRQEHYFGETLETVYSELINQQTSFLSMQMVSLKDAGQALLLKNMATVYWLFFLSAVDSKDFLQSLREGMIFAETNSTSKEIPETETAFRENLLFGVHQTLKRTKTSFVEIPALKKSALLLRRLKRWENGRFPATHAIHLYCNKLGFSLSQEAKVYELLIQSTKKTDL